ncbi:MAG: hypothetical protein F6K30_18915 [Cyanothece sp. SIO2G6]|nr:hypothetical protein [Cyanothece sp. SIO2G6]
MSSQAQVSLVCLLGRGEILGDADGAIAQRHFQPRSQRYAQPATNICC